MIFNEDTNQLTSTAHQIQITMKVLETYIRPDGSSTAEFQYSVVDQPIDQQIAVEWPSDLGYPASVNILSRASGVGSPTNHPGFGQRQDTGPVILWSVNRWTKPGLDRTYVVLGTL